IIMLLNEANAVMPPAILSACITSTDGLTMNSPGFATWPMTYTLLPWISVTDTDTNGSDMYFDSRCVMMTCSSATVLPRPSISPTKGNENPPSGLMSMGPWRSGSFQTETFNMSPGFTV